MAKGWWNRAGYRVGRTISPYNVGRNLARVPFIRNRAQGFANAPLRSEFLGGIGPKPWYTPPIKPGFGNPPRNAYHRPGFNPSVSAKYGPMNYGPAKAQTASRFDRTPKGSAGYAKYNDVPKRGPRTPLKTKASQAYRATERASMKIPARRYVLGAGAVVGAGILMNKMMNRRRGQFYTHYFDY